MCPPEYYKIQYTINPWMKNQVGQVHPQWARQQWNDFFSTLREHAEIMLIEPRPHVPDMVFTANAGLLWRNKFIPSRFRHQERRAEEPCFKKWFQAQNCEIVEWKEPCYFEGAGDALFQPGRDLIWAGHGFRTDARALDLLEKELRVRVIGLRLIDPRFYHLDTCFCPLADDQVMYYPPAFDAASRQRIEENVRPENRIIVSTDDALQFACNAVLVDKTILMNHAGAHLKKRLENAGYSVHIKPVTEFLKAGGANKCLTMQLETPAERAKGFMTGPPRRQGDWSKLNRQTTTVRPTTHVQLPAEALRPKMITKRLS